MKLRKTGVWKIVFYSEFNFKVKSNFSGLKILSHYLGYLDFCVHSNVLRLSVQNHQKMDPPLPPPLFTAQSLLLLVGGLLS